MDRVHSETISKLRKVFGTEKNRVILLPAPGQSAIEMVAQCLIQKGEEAYICSNGFFSYIIEEILSLRGAKVKKFEQVWANR